MKDILAAKGYERHDSKLNYVIKSSQLTKIAVRIGDWESCALLLGLSKEDVNDIIEEKSRARTRKITMLLRWKELKGNEATYLKLIEALAQIGRRDLIEFILGSEIKLPKSDSEEEEYLNFMDENSREIRHVLFLVLTSFLKMGKPTCTL